MKNHQRREPCGNCPFRKSAPLAHWHPTMYEMLAALEKKEHDVQTMRVFGCHKDRHGDPDEQEYCVGWLLYQRKRGVPNLALRLALIMNDSALIQFREAHVEDDELYETITELVQANLARDQELHPERYEL